jgi:ribosome-associated protein
MKEIIIDTEYIKLDSFLKFAGESVTGSDAKETVLHGNVSVNGETCVKRGKKLKGGDVVSTQDREYKVTRK